MDSPEVPAADVLRTDGAPVHLRPVRASDRDGLLALNADASDRSIYLRFFATNRHAADQFVDRMLRSAADEYQTVVAEIGDRIIGAASFERVSETDAEIGLLIADEHQHEGIGTLLLEQLAGIARQRGLRRFVADVLTENGAMLKTFLDSGFTVNTEIEAGTSKVMLELEPTAQLLDAMDSREETADVASLRSILQPSAVVVVGAGLRERSVGHQVLANIVAGGYPGKIYVINPNRSQVLGVTSYAKAAELPSTPDLAVIAVPAAQVVGAVRDCGLRGVRAVVVLSSGFSETGPVGLAEQQRLTDTIRHFGMRMVGPNCLGLVNTDSHIRLNATFASLPSKPGGLAVVSQSGALGIAVLQAANRYGIGISQFVSTGNKADVSSNDLLMWWHRDEHTKLIALYLESFGNPRKFARIARRVSRTKPIIAIKSGRSVAGQRAGLSHTAAAASDDAVVDALFLQAGVLRMAGMQQLLDAALALSDQPVPAGPRVGILGNSGGPGILAADAAVTAGLDVVEFSDGLRATLAAAAPLAASTQNPADLGAGAQPDAVCTALSALLTSGEVDAVLTVFTETLVANPDQIIAAISRAAAGTHLPIVLTQVGEQTRALEYPGLARPLPVYGFPERAARALGDAWQYGRITALPTEVATRPPGLSGERARALVDGWISRGIQWLDPVQVADVLACYGIASLPQVLVGTADQALAAARQFAGPVAMKLANATVHKSEVGGVRLDLRDESEIRQAYQQLSRSSPQVLVQPMAAEGTEIIAGGLQEEKFGPVVMLGAGGIFADLLGDRCFRLAPVARSEALQMITDLRFSRLLDGYRGRPRVSRAVLADLIVRLGWLLEDLPQVAELDLNPVIARGELLVVVDAKVRVGSPATRVEAVSRALRGAKLRT